MQVSAFGKGDYELDEHYGSLLIGTRHNASIENLDNIARPYLAIDHWHQEDDATKEKEVN